jgi:hypothetical protein
MNKTLGRFGGSAAARPEARAASRRKTEEAKQGRERRVIRASDLQERQLSAFGRTIAV